MIPLSELCTVQQGLQLRNGLDDLRPGSYFLIQTRDFDKDDDLNSDWSSTLFRFDPSTPVQRYLLQAGDVLFLTKGFRNFAWTVPPDMPNLVPAGMFLILRPITPQIHSDYLTWYLNSSYAQAYLRSNASQGSNIPFIKKSDLELIPIPLPALSIQTAIAELEALRRQEARLLHKLTALRQHCLSVVSHLSATRNQHSLPQGEKPIP